jgi:hypothetical protein
MVEAAGSLATDIAVPFMRSAPALKNVASSIIQGAGEAEEIEDIPRQAITSGIISGATELAGKGIKAAAFEDPTKILTKSVGARSAQTKMPESRNIQGIVQRLDKKGFFKQGEVAIDPATKQYKRVSKSLGDLFKPQTLDSLVERANKSISVLKSKNNNLIENKKITESDFLNKINDAIADMSYDPQGFNISAREGLARDTADIIKEDLIRRGVWMPGKDIPATAIEQAKKTLDAHVGTSAFKKRAEDLGLNPESLLLFRRKLDDLVDNVAGLEYKQNNEMMSDLISLENTIVEKLSKDYVDTGSTLIDNRNITNRILESISPTPVDIMRSDVSNILQTKPAEIGTGVLKRTPTELLIQSPYSYFDSGREPQSVGLTPKDLIKYRIPRSTQGILENKEKVLAKLSQQGVPKEMIHTVAQAMNGEPDDLSNLASIMVSQFPDLFEKSKYMVFDGKFLNPNDRAKAADDISKRDNLDSIQRAKMISKINKTGEVPEGM